MTKAKYLDEIRKLRKIETLEEMLVITKSKGKYGEIEIDGKVEMAYPESNPMSSYNGRVFPVSRWQGNGVIVKIDGRQFMVDKSNLKDHAKKIVEINFGSRNIVGMLKLINCPEEINEIKIAIRKRIAVLGDMACVPGDEVILQFKPRDMLYAGFNDTKVTVENVQDSQIGVRLQKGVLTMLSKNRVKQVVR